MLKRIARAIVPAAVRRWSQRRKLERLVEGFQRRVVEHRYGQTTLKVEIADPLAAGWYDHDWDPLPELTILRRGHLRPGARVFDIGAHQGVVGLILAHAVGSSGQVILVEPNRHNAAMCTRNADLNATPWAILHQSAIADWDGVMAFNHGFNGQAAELSDYGGVDEVPVTTIDNLSNRYGKPDVVFIDVEGYECRALAGAVRTLTNQADWFVEVHVGQGLEAAGGSPEQVMEYFPKSKYSRYIHSEGDREAIPLESAPASKTQERFFLTAISRDSE